ncbi:DM9 repeat-containing protein [Oceanicola sp. S124]|uniref:DM9 repeat-containing protein n=1 Tax=Oceanicola sp. S124 TaxID=1042378 RepID=UPI0002558972|nr:DM9 repeat-containing protein [Oceanicola sp. S124]
MMTMTALAVAALLMAPVGAELALAPAAAKDQVTQVKTDLYWLAASGGREFDGPWAQGRESNGESLYVCAVEAFGGRHAGKARPGLDGCHFGHNGREYKLSTYEVLINDPGSWRYHTPRAPIPDGAFQIGHEADMTPLYLCLAEYRGGYQPGEIGAHTKGCRIGYSGKELKIRVYQLYVD